MLRSIPFLVLLAILAAAPFALAADEAPGYVMRYADVGAGQIVFTYEDDLWLVPLAGGDAHRITSHPGRETAAKFSPDGRRLFYIADQRTDNDFELYLVDVSTPDPTVPQLVSGAMVPGADVSAAVWAPDSQRLAFVVDEYGDFVGLAQDH